MRESIALSPLIDIDSDGDASIAIEAVADSVLIVISIEAIERLPEVRKRSAIETGTKCRDRIAPR